MKERLYDMKKSDFEQYFEKMDQKSFKKETIKKYNIQLLLKHKNKIKKMKKGMYSLHIKYNFLRKKKE